MYALVQLEVELAFHVVVLCFSLDVSLRLVNFQLQRGQQVFIAWLMKEYDIACQCIGIY